MIIDKNALETLPTSLAAKYNINIMFNKKYT